MSEDISSLDLKSLQSRINEIKKEGSEVSDFTIQYLTCLMDRHDLQRAIPDDVEFEDVPDSIVQQLRNGEIPSEDEILIMDSATQNFFCFELIFFCGLYALARYGGTEPTKNEDGEDDESICDIVWGMRSMSMAHYMATYIIAGLTLLMGQVPSQKLVEQIVDNFNSDEEQLQQNMDYFVELASSILTRYMEDGEYYYDEDHPEKYDD